MRVPRRLSMTRHEEFAAVRKRGKSAAGPYFVMGTLAEKSVEHLKIGFITSRRCARRAVVRNRIRRQFRAILSKHGDRLESGRYLVMVGRHRAADASFQELEAEWLRLAKRLGILRENP